MCGEKNKEQGKTESFVLLRAEFWCKFSARQQWVFLLMLILATMVAGNCLPQSSENLWWAALLEEESCQKSANPQSDLNLLQTGASSQGSPPSPGRGEWEMTVGIVLQRAEGLLSGNSSLLVSRATELHTAAAGFGGLRLHSSASAVPRSSHAAWRSVGTKSCDCICNRERRWVPWLPQDANAASPPCSGVDIKAQVPQMFGLPATDVSGGVSSKADLEPRAKLLLTWIAMDQAEQGQGLWLFHSKLVLVLFYWHAKSLKGWLRAHPSFFCRHLGPELQKSWGT